MTEILEFLHLENIQNKFPHQISSGEAQRAALARSLLSMPDLLLLDEPLSNIDQSEEVTIYEDYQLVCNDEFTYNGTSMVEKWHV